MQDNTASPMLSELQHDNAIIFPAYQIPQKPPKLELQDLKGAFLILIFVYILAFFVLLIVIAVKHFYKVRVNGY